MRVAGHDASGVFKKSTLKSFQKEPNDNDKFDQYVDISRA